MIIFQGQSKDGSIGRELRIRRSVAPPYSHVIRQIFFDTYPKDELGEFKQIINTGSSDPEVLDNFIHWLKFQTLDGRPKLDLEHAMILWLLADRFEIPSLQNLAVDHCFLIEFEDPHDGNCSAGFFEYVFPVRLIQDVWARTTASSELRQLAMLLISLTPVGQLITNYFYALPEGILDELVEFNLKLGTWKISPFEFWKQSTPSQFYVFDFDF